MVERFPQNPLLVPSDCPPSREGLRVVSLLNPAAFVYKGEVRLLIRVAERPEQEKGWVSVPVFERGRLELLRFRRHDPKLDARDPRAITYAGRTYLTRVSHLRMAGSADGIDFRVARRPTLAGEGPAESYGIEDPRVVRIGRRYFITYTAVSGDGVAVALASTSDWRSFRRGGVIFPPHNKDAVLFPESLGGRYMCLHRPRDLVFNTSFVWIAESKDLLHWGNHRRVFGTRPGAWDSSRVGAGAEPIRTRRGWLVIYHGADERNRYALGAALLDGRRPWIVKARSRKPIMEPTAPYEKKGFFGNVIFTNGHVVRGDEAIIYYGASDSVVCAARASINEILRSLGR